MGLCETPECGFIVLQSAMADKGAQANDLCLSALSRRRWGLRDMAKGDSEKQPGDGKSGKAAKKEGGRGIERRLAGMLNSAAGLSGKAFKRAANSSLLADTLFKSPERLELMGKAGRALKDMRQTAGLSVEELSSIIDLNDPDILRAVEEGKTGLPVDVMLRLASYYSRNDPLPFIIRFSRTYHPWLSQFLNMTGLDRLMIKAERERKFLKIYRNVDNARKLSDEDFEEVLAFTRRAFNMALHFAEDRERVEPSRRKKAKSAKTKHRDKDKAASSSGADASPSGSGGNTGETPKAEAETPLTEETLDQLDSMVQSEFEASMAEEGGDSDQVVQGRQSEPDGGTAQEESAATSGRAAAPKKAPARKKAASSNRRKASAAASTRRKAASGGSKAENNAPVGREDSSKA